MQKKGVLLHPEDNVVVVLEAVQAGDTVLTQSGDEELVAQDAVNFGHKLARCDLDKGQVVVKYGNPMGRTLEVITRGAHVHVHNIAGLMGDSSREAAQ